LRVEGAIVKRLYLAWIPARGHTRADALTYSTYDFESAARSLARQYYEDDRTLDELVVRVAALDGLAESESGAVFAECDVRCFPEWMFQVHSFDAEPVATTPVTPDTNPISPTSSGKVCP
jgi:hypothetical protein